MTKTVLSHRFCVAPMMDWTDRHCRYFMRLLSSKALLYTEMVTTGAILHGDQHRHLRFDAFEQPLALQLGGSNATELAACAQIAEQHGYQEINLNVGCPSDRVQNHMIGACLMEHAPLVGDCVAAMQAKVSIPVTVKCRIGIDQMDSDQALADFINTVANRSTCRTFIVHARIAILQGLSPKENREIPPLNYPRVYWIKQQFPQLEIVINGGIRSLEAAADQLQHVDGVMLGREAYQNPWLLHSVDEQLFGCASSPETRASTIQHYYEYIERQLAQGVPLHHMTRHLLGLFHGQYGGKAFRRHLSDMVQMHGAGIEVLQAAVAGVTSHKPKPLTDPQLC